MQFNKHNILKILETNELGFGSLVGQNDTIFNLIREDPSTILI